MNQHTLNQSLEFSGKGLHTGKQSRIRLVPAPADSGIVFRHIQANGQVTEIPAHWSKVKTLPLCTCIAHDKVQVRTIEHLMAAFYACDINNVIIEIQGDEVPIMDGSALPFIQGMQTAGITEQDRKKKIIRILKPVSFSEDERQVSISPCDEFSLDLTISLAKIGRLNWKGTITPEIFSQEIAMARTFGRLRNGIIARIVSRFTKVPIGLGASTSSTLVIIGDKVINKGGLRVPDEYIRHRILDTVGDMMLAGADIRGCIKGESTAHRLNHGLLQNIFSDDDAWCWDDG